MSNLTVLKQLTASPRNYGKDMLLKRFPEMGKQIADPRFSGIRMLIIGNYLVLYEIQTEENVVHLHRFFHGVRDYPKLFLSMK